ncbi:TPA: DUF5677 domain-containing protein [Pseudomonas aeruginosa]|uniref:DUF5677 domain-containing protein n=1 Tax=Pseudomonas aeruginosa TaxID=287 RepID=UPI0004D5E283|nr:DUF5677 domain-containing protein [Pseudomonas aeruginosa]KEA14428.1 hypothetical protein Y905_25715 [Pseudomonas aeruginosa C2159M]KEI24509.1 hypothetical protein CH80_29410 [Pseudomonas aeruginosa]KQC50259.1 hypothetical protein APG04_20605 [Pseudomonas aeruginosa]KQC56109.1 hypothetical protein APG03_25405 [Pseudomonas aeruginosa]KQC70284.1 hypothetical protein APG06_24070 [Pseudomonas aeruginosa]
MELEQVYVEQRHWAEKGLFLMRDLLPLMTPFSTSQLLTAEARRELGALLTAAASSGESIFLLLAYGQLWEAEMLMRPVFEASIKFAYIVQNKSDFESRLLEFGKDQFQIALMKDDQKARDLLAILPDPDSDEWRPIRDIVLPDDYRDELRARYDKATRRAMETRWGFTGLIKALSSSGDPLYQSLPGLALSYSQASHLIHADSVGVHMPLERDYRESERRTTLHFAHLAKLISDCFTCFLIRLGVAYRFAGVPLDPYAGAVDRVGVLMEELSPYYKIWMGVEYGQASGRSGDLPG